MSFGEIRYLWFLVAREKAITHTRLRFRVNRIYKSLKTWSIFDFFLYFIFNGEGKGLKEICDWSIPFFFGVGGGGGDWKWYVIYFDTNVALILNFSYTITKQLGFGKNLVFWFHTFQKDPRPFSLFLENVCQHVSLYCVHMYGTQFFWGSPTQ